MLSGMQLSTKLIRFKDCTFQFCAQLNTKRHHLLLPYRILVNGGVHVVLSVHAGAHFSYFFSTRGKLGEAPISKLERFDIYLQMFKRKVEIAE